MLVIFSSFGIFRGFQNTTWALKVVLLGAIINILLDILLIEGVAGYIPAMGVAGSAWASVTSLLIMLLFSLYFLKKLPSDWTLKSGYLIPNKQMAVMSFNMIIRLFALNLTILIAQRIAASMGTKYLSSLSILMNYWLFTSFFIDGYATAAIALAGKFKGAGKIHLLTPLLQKTTIINMVIAILLAIGSILFIYNFTHIWPSKIEIQTISSSVWIPLNITILLGAFAFTLDGFFIGLGKMKELRNTLIIATVVFCIPLIFFNINWTYPFLWHMISLWVLIRGLIPLIYYTKKHPHKILPTK